MSRVPTLEDVLITDQLERRQSRAPNLTLENNALHELARKLGTREALSATLKTALDVCEAGTAGVSLLEGHQGGTAVFRWIALAGRLEAHVGGSSSRHNSPCGVALDRNAPQLFWKSARYFECFESVQPMIHENLVVPFHYEDVPWGTLWIVSHKEDPWFDLEDVRVMTSLCGLVSVILRIAGYAGPRQVVAGLGMGAESRLAVEAAGGVALARG